MMRLLFTLQLICISALSFGQDIILTKDAEEIDAKVLTISETEINYQLKGQTVRRTIAIDKIFMIKYANGEKEVFKPDTSLKTEQSEQVSARSNDGLPPASRAYKLFDLYNENGVRGVVIEVSDGGYHGKIISLDETKCSFMKGGTMEMAKERFGLSDLNDGRVNQNILLRYLSNSLLLTMEHFPALQWCLAHGKGWYLPAQEELERFYWSMIDNPAGSNKVSILCARLNGILEFNGGKKISGGSLDFYLSSTEDKYSYGSSYMGDIMLKGYIPMRGTSFYYGNNQVFAEERERGLVGRYEKAYVRAFHRF